MAPLPLQHRRYFPARLTVIGVALAAPHLCRIRFAPWTRPWSRRRSCTIAAASIAPSIGLPSHIVDILEGESLINDATGLALEFATEILRPRTRHHPEWRPHTTAVVSPTAFSSVGSSIASNATLKMPPSKVHQHPRSLRGLRIVSFSCVCVAAHFFSPSVRLKVLPCGRSVNGFVFVLIGLQFPRRASIHEYKLTTLIYGGGLSLPVDS